MLLHRCLAGQSNRPFSVQCAGSSKHSQTDLLSPPNASQSRARGHLALWDSRDMTNFQTCPCILFIGWRAHQNYEPYEQNQSGCCKTDIHCDSNDCAKYRVECMAIAGVFVTIIAVVAGTSFELSCAAGIVNTRRPKLGKDDFLHSFEIAKAQIASAQSRVPLQGQGSIGAPPTMPYASLKLRCSPPSSSCRCRSSAFSLRSSCQNPELSVGSLGAFVIGVYVHVSFDPHGKRTGTDTCDSSLDV